MSDPAPVARHTASDARPDARHPALDTRQLATDARIDARPDDAMTPAWCVHSSILNESNNLI